MILGGGGRRKRRRRRGRRKGDRRGNVGDRINEINNILQKTKKKEIVNKRIKR